MDQPGLLTDRNILDFFLVSFGIVLSLIFLVYAIVFLRQTQIMNKTLKTNLSPKIQTVSTIQIALAALLLVLAFILA